MSDAFARLPGDDRLDAEVPAALAARVHARATTMLWASRIALGTALLLVAVAAVVTGLAVQHDSGLPFAAMLLAVGAVATGAAAVLARVTRARTRRVLASSAPEGGVVLGLSDAGLNLAHLPLLEWDSVTAIGICDAAGSGGREVTVAVVVPDVGAARARMIDARLARLVRPLARHSPGRRRSTDAVPGLLCVDLGELLTGPLIDAVLLRLETEAVERDIPFHRTTDRRRLGRMLRSG